MSSVTDTACSWCSRGASSIAAISLHTVSGVAGFAKTATAMAGALALTAITVDTIQFYQFGINNLPDLYKLNNCVSPAPTLVNLYSKYVKDLDCYDSRKTFPEYFQQQATLFPIALCGLYLGNRVFSKIEGSAKRWGDQYASQWTLRQMKDNYELNEALKKLA